MLKPVQFADWAVLIVPVLKSEKKSVGIFDDSVNQVSRGGMSKSQLSQRHQIAADECPSM